MTFMTQRLCGPNDVGRPDVDLNDPMDSMDATTVWTHLTQRRDVSL